jgi:ankyrin repeat protein
MTKSTSGLVLSPEVIGDPARLRDCIARGAALNERTCNHTPLGFAVRRGLVDSCEILLDAGADPQLGGWNSSESLLCLVVESRYTELDKLIQVPPPAVVDDATRALCRMLVQHGVDPNGVVSENGVVVGDMSPLFMAAKNGDAALVEFLVELGANVDQQCDECVGGVPLGYVKTALRRAKDGGCEDMMVTLLELGADDACIKYGRLTGFQHCVELGYDKVVEYYLRVRGEDLTQIAEIGSARQTLEQLAVKESTKALLRSFAVESAVATEVGASSDDAALVAPSRSTRGMAL